MELWEKSPGDHVVIMESGIHKTVVDRFLCRVEEATQQHSTGSPLHSFFVSVASTNKRLSLALLTTTHFYNGFRRKRHRQLGTLRIIMDTIRTG
jgi:N-acetylglucosamine-6-phosphate deacetylase